MDVTTPILVGRYVIPPGGGAGTDLFCDDRPLVRHVDRPYFRAYAEQRLGSPLRARQSGGEETDAKIDPAILARHGFTCGATGGGKSRAQLHLILSQIRAGCSAVVIDPKGELIERLLDAVIALGYPPERVTLIDPTQSGIGPPGLNPLITELPLGQIAGDIVHVVERSSSTWGPRLGDLLINALFILGAHQLSVYELGRFLQREDYRSALLHKPANPTDPLAYAEARTYFEEEFGAWGRSERAGAVSPVLNKVREWCRSQFLRPFLCAKRNTLDLSRLWQECHLVLLRLDRPTLGEGGARLLSSLLTNLLLRTALRASGPVPVVLTIDELSFVERFVGSAVADTVAIARSQNLRCQVAFQHLEQLSDGLRACLLGNCAYQLMFRAGPIDAKLAAASLAAGVEPSMRRLCVGVDKVDPETQDPELAKWRHTLCDKLGQPLRLHRRAGTNSKTLGNLCRTITELEAVTVAHGIDAVYVRSPDTGEPVELRRYLDGLNPGEYYFDLSNLALFVFFPRPRFKSVERTSEADAARMWTRQLQDLPVQHAVLRIAGVGAGVVKVADVPDLAVQPRARSLFVQKCAAANGQSLTQIQSDIEWRTAEVERVAAGHCQKRGGDNDVFHL